MPSMSTENVYFNDVSHIYYKLTEWRNREVYCIQLMAMVMSNKFEKYWDSFDSLLTFGLILYPHYKML